MANNTTTNNKAACQSPKDINPNLFLEKTHQFSIDDAQKYGLVAAVIIQNIRYHLMLNASNNVCFEDGKYWAYTSVKSLLKLMPYIPRQTFYDNINRLEAKNAIIRKSKYVKKEKVTFFTLGDELYPKIEKDNAQVPKYGYSTLLPDQSTESALLPLYKNNKNKNKGVPPDGLTASFSSKEIIDYFNNALNKNYKHDSRGTEMALRWILKQRDISFNDIKLVIDYKRNEWGNSTSMKKHLNPTTLFRESNFWGYLDNAKEHIRQEASNNWEKEFDNAWRIEKEKILQKNEIPDMNAFYQEYIKNRPQSK